MTKSMKKLPQAMVIAVSLMLIGLTVLRVSQSWPNDSHLDHVSGAWVALATDVHGGVFYRAPYGPEGYGGTRFFPLFFVLHALGIFLSGSWRFSGYILSAISLLALITGVYFLLRKLGIDRWLSLAGCAAVLAGSSVQDAFLTIREDGLAAALNVWGLTLCVGDTSRKKLYAAAVLFSLAFATKETSVFGAGAVVLSLLLGKKFKDAMHLGLATTAGYVVVLSTMYAASAGRAFEGLRLTLATGSGLKPLLNSPITMVEAMNGYRAEMMLFALALTALLIGRQRLTSLLFLCTLAVTLVIFSSEGTAGNHLIDLLVASVVIFTVWISQYQEIGVCLLASASLVAWLGLMVQHRYDDLVPVHTQLEEIVKACGNSGKPILSDNPLVPLTAGQHPYVLDAFMFRVLEEREANFGDPMWKMLRERRFGAVVLVDNPDTEEGKVTYDNFHFGDDFMEVMRQNYEPAGSAGTEYIFLPKKPAQATSP
jgi:hypothetical protein